MNSNIYFKAAIFSKNCIKKLCNNYDCLNFFLHQETRKRSFSTFDYNNNLSSHRSFHHSTNLIESRELVKKTTNLLVSSFLFKVLFFF